MENKYRVGDVYTHTRYGDCSIYVLAGILHTREWDDEIDVIFLMNKSKFFGVPSYIVSSEYCKTPFNICDNTELFTNVVFENDGFYITKYIDATNTISLSDSIHVPCDLGDLNSYVLGDCGHIIYGDDCKVCLHDSIKNYSYKGYELKFKDSDSFNEETKDLYVGFEIEFEHNVKDGDLKIRKQKLAMLIKQQFPDLIAECKNDGSLINGFECVSHPIHIDLIGGKWFNERLDSLFTLLKENDCVMADTCGLHFHLSNRGLGDLKNTHCNLFLMLDVFQDLMRKVSGRYQLTSRTLLNTYSSCYSDDDDTDYEEDYEEDVLFSYCHFTNSLPMNKRKQRKSHYEYRYDNLSSHYNALNIENENTTEIRFFGGTLELDSFLFKIDFIKSMVLLCKKENVHNVTFGDIISGLPEKSKEYSTHYYSQQDLYRTIIDYDLIDETSISTDTLNNIYDITSKLDTYITNTFEKHIYFRRDSRNIGLRVDDTLVNTMILIDLYLKNKIKSIDEFVDKLTAQRVNLIRYMNFFSRQDVFAYSRITKIMKNTLTDEKDAVDKIIEDLSTLISELEVIIENV